MTTDRIAVGGASCISVTLHVPSIGPWWADCVLVDNTDVSGRTTIEIGDSVTCYGTVSPSAAGSFAEQRLVRVIAGAGSWASLLGSAAYHNDGPGGVRALRVATDAAQAAGETLGDFAPANESVGKDYIRESGNAARTLEDVIGGASWWVDFDGVTQVGTRATQDATPGSYELLEYDPINRVATLAMDDLSSIVIGSVLAADSRMPVAQTVRELRYEISGGDAVVYATCGEADARGRLTRALRSMIRRSIDEKFYAPARYRVSRRNADRLELQAVTVGMPNIGPISMAPGLAGAHSDIVEGSILVVQFIEGDRRLPMVMGFAGKDGTGFVPLNTTIDVTTLLKLGASASDFVALAPSVNSQFDAINTALDALANAIPTAMDGGAALQTAFKVAWPGTPPADPSDVGATKVKAE